MNERYELYDITTFDSPDGCRRFATGKYTFEYDEDEKKITIDEFERLLQMGFDIDYLIFKYLS